METEIMKNFVSIDCVSESKLCKENDVISYPAIRLFRKNKSVARYRGPRKAIL
jgi:protein disulfide-isomerase A1